MKIVLDTGKEYDLTDKTSFENLRGSIYKLRQTAGKNKTHLNRLLIIYSYVKKYAKYKDNDVTYIRARAIYDLIAPTCEANCAKPSTNKTENVNPVEKPVSEEIKVNAEKPKTSADTSQTIEVLPANTAQAIPTNNIPQPIITELPANKPAAPNVVMPLPPVKFFETNYQQHLNERRIDKNKYNLQEKEKRRLSYLDRPVTEKKKIGEDNFAESVMCMLFDLEKYPSGTTYLPLYLALVCGLYMHNASHYPMQGYGKAQALEIDHKLQYFRSESDHPRRIFFDNLVKAVMNEKSVGYLPRNQPFTKILALTSLDKDFANKFANLNEAGYVTSDEKVKNFGPTIGYTGARTNNLMAYLYAINTKCVTENSEVNIEDMKNFLQRDLMDSSYKIKLTNSLSQKLRKTMPNDVVTQVNFMLKKFQELRDKHPRSTINNNLFAEILAVRIARVRHITEISKKRQWKNLQILNGSNTTCLEIRLYPEYKGKLLNSRNFKGLTNAIIGFLGGLINHYAQKRNLFINVQRRQSFGFLRSTLDDTDGLTIRVSLGLEDEIFDSILIESLTKLNELLTTFNFINDNHDTVKECKKTCGKSQTRSGEATEKTDNRIGMSMRSINKKWQAVNEAHNKLNQHCADKQGDYFVSAFNDYLKAAIIDRATIKDFEISTLGFNIDIDKSVIQKKSNDTALQNPPAIFKILGSLVDYTLAYIAEIEMLDEKNTLHDLKYSYWQTLWKLYSNVSKARFVLNSLGKYEITHLSAKAMLLTENIQEYLILLDGLRYIRDEANEKKNTAVEDLRKSQRTYVASQLDVGAERVKIFYTDSGQQANVASIIAMDMQVYPDNTDGKHLSDQSVYVFENSYFELSEFFKNVKGLRTYNQTTAQIAFIDIRHLGELKLEKFPALKAVIVDITHNSTITVDELNTLSKKLLGKGKWVVFTTSALKHEEIGLDKYQSGRIVVVSPKEGKLHHNVEEELNAVSDSAMHPLIASYLSMVDKVYHSSNSILNVSAKTSVHAATPADNPANRTPSQEKAQPITQLLTGKLSDGTNVSFTRVHNTGIDRQGRAGSCGFIALNTNREAVLTALTVHLNDEEVKQYLRAEIENDFEIDRAKLRLSHEHMSLLNKRKNKLKNSEVQRNQVIAKLIPITNLKEPSVDDLIQYFQGREIPHKEVYLRRLEDVRKSHETAQTKLSKFLSSDALLTDYLKQNIPNEWIGANVALAWAKAANVTLRIWTHRDQGTESPEIYLRQSVQGGADAQTIDILHTWNATHYERITLQPPVLVNVPIQPQQNTANKENQLPKAIDVEKAKIKVLPLSENKNPNSYAQNVSASMWNTSKSPSPHVVQPLLPILTAPRAFQR